MTDQIQQLWRRGMMNANHSPLPFRRCAKNRFEVRDANGSIVAIVFSRLGNERATGLGVEANAELIVAACNGHERLERAARSALDLIQGAAFEGPLHPKVRDAAMRLREGIGSAGQPA